MKQGSNNRRSRSRGGGKRHSGGKNQNFESNGPEAKIRGSAQQVQEKYLALARDATTSGDRIAAESFFQYAEHYHRILNPEGGNGAGKAQGRGGRNDGKPATPEKPAAPIAEAKVVDNSVAALSVVPDPVSVDTGTQEKTEPAADSGPAADSEPEKAAS